MDKTLKRKASISKAISKLSLDLISNKTSKFKSKHYDFQQIHTSRAHIQSFANLARLTSTKNTALNPIPSENLRVSKKTSIRNKRNLSVEGHYEDTDPEDRTLKRNSSLLENYPKEEHWDSSKTPYSPAVVLKLFAKHLTPMEQSEILSYRYIYYIGADVHKLEGSSKQPNNGFDDERNDYILVKNDHIVYRYEILEIIGRGSYGQVIKAFDHKDKKLIALKIIRNLSCIIQQAKIEIQVLYKLLQNNHGTENVVIILDNYLFRNHIIESFDLLDMNLYQYMKSKAFKSVPLPVVKGYAQQIFEGIRFYQSLDIIHCDLKPENLMLSNESNKLTIIDFGSACFLNKRVFSYIQSRYYRAPEVILEVGYDNRIDIWSVGCVLAELVIGKPIFPGKDEMDQLLAMTEYLGMPPVYMLEQSPKYPLIVESLKKATNSNSSKTRIPNSKSLKNVLGVNDSLFIEFLLSNHHIECFSWNPHERLTAIEALDHEWLKSGSMARHPSLPELKSEKIMVPVKNLTIKRKLTIDQPLTHRALRRSSIFKTNFA